MSSSDNHRSLDSAQLGVVQSLYVAERADGSAIFAISTQIIAVMVTYAAIAFGVLGTESILPNEAWIRGLIAVPLWGLGAYLVIANALMAARVASIERLEQLLLSQIREQIGPFVIGSDAGDWATNITRQPGWLRPASLMSYLAAFSGVFGLSGFAVTTSNSTSVAVVASAVYVLFAVVVVLGFAFVYALSPFQKLSLRYAMEKAQPLSTLPR